MYQDYLAPRAIQEIVRLDAFREAGRSKSITEELRFARALMPHLQRAVAVQVRLADAASVAQSALNALGTAQARVLLLDRRCRVVHASVGPERLLREADGLSTGPAGLRAGR